MEKGKLLIADGSRDFTDALKRELGAEYQISSCATGVEALDLCRSLEPQILLLDLSLAQPDGLTLLSQLREAGYRGKVLASSRLMDADIQKQLYQLQVSYVVLRPCPASALAELVRGLSGGRPESLSQEHVRTLVQEILLELGLDSRHQGFFLTVEAICHVVRNPGSPLTKEVYPALAREYGGNALQVERSIRGAILHAWERKRSPGPWARYLPTTRDGQALRPGNTGFVTAVADHVRAKLR